MSDPYGQSQPASPQAQPAQAQPAQAQPEQWPPSASAPAAPGDRSPVLANVSFVIGLVLVLLGAVFMLTFPLFYSLPDPFAAINASQIVNGVLTALLGIAATVTGAIALLRGGRGRGRARAAAGLVLGVSALFSLLTTLLQGLMFQFI